MQEQGQEVEEDADDDFGIPEVKRTKQVNVIDHERVALFSWLDKVCSFTSHVHARSSACPAVFYEPVKSVGRHVYMLAVVPGHLLGHHWSGYW